MPSTSRRIFSPAERVQARRRLGRHLRRLLRRRRGGAGAPRRRGQAHPGHRPRLPARRGGAGRALLGEVRRPRRGRRRPRRARGPVSARALRARLRAREGGGPRLGAARRGGGRARRPSAARSMRCERTGSGTGSAQSRTRTWSPSWRSGASSWTSRRSRTSARARSASLAEHPLPKLVAAGVRCSISTDDPAMFDTDLTPGLRRCEARSESIRAPPTRPESRARSATRRTRKRLQQGRQRATTGPNWLKPS